MKSVESLQIKCEKKYTRQNLKSGWVLNSGEQKNKINSVTHFLGSLFWYKQQLFVFKKRMIAMSDEICENSI